MVLMWLIPLTSVVDMGLMFAGMLLPGGYGAGWWFTCGVGFSGVDFALVTFWAHAVPHQCFWLGCGFPKRIIPWIWLVITKV